MKMTIEQRRELAELTNVIPPNLTGDDPMKTIPALYQCEICNRKYDVEADAIQCEMQGVLSESEHYPVGMILADKDDYHYGNITFALAKYDEVHGHDTRYVLWACRGAGNDSLGSQMCGSSNGHYHRRLKKEHRCNPDVNSVHFKRMVAYLESENIPVTIWDGTRPVPLAEYLDMA